LYKIPVADTLRAPDTTGDWIYVDRPPNAAAEQQAARVYRTLVELDAENPAQFRFAADAQELFIDWLTALEMKIRADDLHPALVSHLSKYRSLMPSLALLFELADLAGSEGFEGSSRRVSENFVSLEHTRQAAAFCDYLESQAGRVYSCLVTPQLRAARELADKIKRRKLGAAFSSGCVPKGMDRFRFTRGCEAGSASLAGCRMDSRADRRY